MATSISMIEYRCPLILYAPRASLRHSLNRERVVRFPIKEGLIKSAVLPIILPSSLSGEIEDGAADVRRSGIRGQEAGDPSGEVSGSDGTFDSMGTVGDTDSALLPDGGTGPASLPLVDLAADPLRAAILQPERSGDRGSAL